MPKIRIAERADLPKIIELIKRNREPLNEDLEAVFNLKNPNEKCRFCRRRKWHNSGFCKGAFLQVEKKRLCDKYSR